MSSYDFPYKNVYTKEMKKQKVKNHVQFCRSKRYENQQQQQQSSLHSFNDIWIAHGYTLDEHFHSQAKQPKISAI